MQYNDDLVERIIMDLSSNVLELENAWKHNHEAVKKNIVHLNDSSKSLQYVVRKIIAGAA